MNFKISHHNLINVYFNIDVCLRITHIREGEIEREHGKSIQPHDRHTHTGWQESVCACVHVCVCDIMCHGIIGSDWVFIPVNSSSTHTRTHSTMKLLEHCQPDSIQNTHTFAHRIFSYYSSLTRTPIYAHDQHHHHPPHHQ